MGLPRLREPGHRHRLTASAAATPRSAGMLRSGTSEILNWITVGGALGGLAFDLVDYIPGYRSPAGTGVGMAFATWDLHDH